jgi:hypothetical protein
MVTLRVGKQKALSPLSFFAYSTRTTAPEVGTMAIFVCLSARFGVRLNLPSTFKKEKIAYSK